MHASPQDGFPSHSLMTAKSPYASNQNSIPIFFSVKLFKISLLWIFTLIRLRNIFIHLSRWALWLFSHQVVSNPFAAPWTIQPPRRLCSWDFPGKNTGVGCHFFLQRIFPPQGWNPASPALKGGFFTTEPRALTKIKLVIYYLHLKKLVI